MVLWIVHATMIGFFTFIFVTTLEAFKLKLFRSLILCLGVLLFVNATLEDISPLLNKVTNFVTGEKRFDMPAQGTITQNFDPPNHHGIDIAIPEGTPILAQGKGTVIEERWDDTYGQVVIIEYTNGLQALYGHNRDILVKKGYPVIKGTKIAYSGNTGNSRGPHLHYEIRIKGKVVNPFLYLEN
ncbi:MAG TPA: M23 family metallopeptidase [Desulfosporosinus sp.]|nr:M23 family metallopeptidase [Desulfosporosinus sp.]